MLFWLYNTLILFSLPILSLQISLKALLKNKRALGTFFFPKIKTSKESIWIHAVSLGEVNTIKPLINELKKLYPQKTLFLSTMTETGFSEASKISDILVFYLPVDLWLIQKKVLKTLNPSVVMYVEGDVWPSLSYLLKKAQIPQIVISAKISEKSLTRLLKFPFLIPFLYGNLTHLGVQDETMQERFMRLGLKKNQLTITGNLKLVNDGNNFIDPSIEEKLASFFKSNLRKKTLIISCTHTGEEELIFKKLKPILSQFNVMLAPRHPNRFEEVKKVLKRLDISFSLVSEGKVIAGSIIFIDAIGLVKSLYQKADVAILGGSFVPGIGGHNVMEPIYQNCFVITGPYMESQSGVVKQMLDQNLGSQTSIDNLLEALSIHSYKAKNFSDLENLLRKNQEILAQSLSVFPKL
jgi:3-deoxy-D-manno-octulosonic-acid transferase